MDDNKSKKVILASEGGKPDRFTREIWQENFDTVGQIVICIGDEPKGCVSVVYKNHKREYWTVNEKGRIELVGDAIDYDWEH